MCNQTVSLIAAAIESRGIATVVLQFLRFIAEAVRPPRALVVPFPHGFALGEPHNSALQRDVLEAALSLLGRDSPPPLIEEFARSR